MFRSVTRWLRAQADDAQLVLPLDMPPRTAEDFHARLRALGLRDILRCRLTRNRAVMVSVAGEELRVHEDFRAAPVAVLRAIVSFVNGRTRLERAAARRVILAFPIATTGPRPARMQTTHEDDVPHVTALATAHAAFNVTHFGGLLQAVPMRVSRRMRSRLGHYAAASEQDAVAHIAISRYHIRHHGDDEVLHTLLHEMVHQWQDETARAIDHGPDFRAKAREIGITPLACRTVQGGYRLPDRGRRRFALDRVLDGSSGVLDARAGAEHGRIAANG